MFFRVVKKCKRNVKKCKRRARFITVRRKSIQNWMGENKNEKLAEGLRYLFWQVR